MKDLKIISQEIRDIIDKKQKELELSFTEAEHIYFMKDRDGIVRNNFPSVSKLLKHFYEPTLQKHIGILMRSLQMIPFFV